MYMQVGTPHDADIVAPRLAWHGYERPASTRGAAGFSEAGIGFQIRARTIHWPGSSRSQASKRANRARVLVSASALAWPVFTNSNASSNTTSKPSPERLQ